MAAALHQLDIHELRTLLVSGQVSAEELCAAYLERIEARNAELNCFLHVDAQGALDQARAVDRQRAAGAEVGVLAGVPLALKDNLCTRGIPTTCASRILEGYRPPYDAHVVERLRSAGAVILGKLNLDEFAMGSSTEASAFGVTRNPWNPERVAGGSSGGSAAAVAAGLCAGALGSDTGGSVRQPGALCGVPALKPTYGRVSRYGLVAFGSSLDQVGPLARSVRDTALLLSVIAGHDARDATSVDRPLGDYVAECGREVRGLRVGVLNSAAFEGCDAEVSATVDQALQRLRGLGCELVDVELPHARYAVSAYYLIAAAEASSNLARFDGMRYGLRVDAGDLKSTYEVTRGQGFGHEVKRRIMLGTYALSAGYYDAFYLKAQKVRTLIRRDYEAAFAKCDVLASPTAPTCAWRPGAQEDPLSMYLMDVFTLPASLAGVPGINVPCGLSAEGLPVGLQLCGPVFEEGRMLRVADALGRELAFDASQPLS